MPLQEPQLLLHLPAPPITLLGRKGRMEELMEEILGGDWDMAYEIFRPTKNSENVAGASGNEIISREAILEIWATTLPGLNHWVKSNLRCHKIIKQRD